MAGVCVTVVWVALEGEVVKGDFRGGGCLRVTFEGRGLRVTFEGEDGYGLLLRTEGVLSLAFEVSWFKGGFRE